MPQHDSSSSQPSSPTYGGFGVFEQKPRNRKKVVVGSTIGLLLIAAVTVGILWATGVFGASTIDHVAVEKGVAQVLRTSYGEQGGKNISCPDNVEAKTGSRFTCRLTLNGLPKTVPVKVINDSYDYQIGAPK